MNKIARIQELRKVAVQECHEKLVEAEGVHCRYSRKDTGVSTVLVREGVAKRLLEVQEGLARNGLELVVVEGWRPLAYQQKYFREMLEKERVRCAHLNEEQLCEHVHQLVADPEVAGHPSGGAIDVTLACDGREIDMGGMIADFSVPALLPTYSKAVIGEQKRNRLLLHDAMVAAGFAPFYGEWWHFSYGDREWAHFYSRPHARYSSH